MSIINFQVTQNAFVSRLQPNTNFGGSAQLLVGTTILDVFQTFIQFDISTLSQEITITSASLELFLLGVTQSSVSKAISVFAALQPWVENEITFTNKPLSETATAATSTVTDQVDTFITWDITSLVKNWHSGALENNGMTLTSADPEVTFASREAVSVNTSIKPLLVIDYQPAIFVNEVEKNLTTTDAFQFSTLRNTSGSRLVSFFISNTGANPVTVELQDSPDGTVFLTESSQNVPAGGAVVLVPQFFTQFVRIAFKSTNTGAPSTIDSWFQAQGAK